MIRKNIVKTDRPQIQYNRGWEDVLRMSDN